MSLFKMMNVTCPNCGEATTVNAVGSVNADRRPDLRDAILNNTFQDTTCENCSENFRLEPEFNYLDVGRGLWLAALPGREMLDFTESEPVARETYDTAYGKDAPAEAQVVGEGLTPRVTYGWQGVREKILLAEHDLDDVVVEVAKLELMRHIAQAPIGADVELRLYIVDEDTLTFLFVNMLTETPLDEVQAPRSFYNEIAEKRDAYRALIDRLDDSVFVDIRKLYMDDEEPQGDAEAAA